MNTNALLRDRSLLETKRFRRIGFLVFPGCEIIDVCGPFDAFYYADYWLARFGRTNEPGYQCRYPGRHPWTGPNEVWNRDRRDPRLL
jgi:hypothetical protein